VSVAAEGPQTLLGEDADLGGGFVDEKSSRDQDPSGPARACLAVQRLNPR
jgi:hypothetical protein